MLIGQYTSVLTAKRRVAVPKKFRQELGKKMIVARWYEGCLVIISEENWQALLTKLTGKAEVIVASVRDTDRFILGSAYETEPDGQGRVVLPELLVTYARLGEEVVFIGLGDRVEIWDREAWSQRETYVSQKAADLIEEYASTKK